ncbi:MAG: hypothetical protein D4Q79_01010 [Spirochaetia bacterium]|nr:MAG: hypothetical protein D4Q79_01010 [Spirochaetia bacterium]
MKIKQKKSCNPAILQSCNYSSGQSLAEILIAIGVGAILIGGTIGIMAPVLRSNLETKNVQIATSLAQQYSDNLRNISEASWFNIYNPPAAKGASSQFYLNATSTTYAIVSGATSTTVEDRNFGIYFSIENVNRDSCGAGNISSEATTTCTNGPGTTGVIDDPSTQKINVHISWTQGGSLLRISYFTRSSNKIFNQTDWSGGSGQTGPITSENNKFASSTGVDYSTTTGAIRIQGL